MVLHGDALRLHRFAGRAFAAMRCERDVNESAFPTFIPSGQSASHSEEGIVMRGYCAVAVAIMLSTGAAYAQKAEPAAAAKSATPTAATQAASSNCEAQALSKDGKPLTGAAKSSFIKKCEAGNKGNAAAACEAKAVGKDGKPLAGAAKASFMKKCEADAGK